MSRKPSPQNLTGVWHGLYSYPYNRAPVSFVATLIEAGSASMFGLPAGAGTGGFSGTGLRWIEPVTSSSLITVDGSKNDGVRPIELVEFGSLPDGAES